MKTNEIKGLQKRNFNLHLTEGSFYLASMAFLNAQTVFPLLVKRMGGSDLSVGMLPVIIYGAYFFPQLFAASYSIRTPYRKPWVLVSGLLQRLQILVLVGVVGLSGWVNEQLGLLAFFAVLSLNQIFGGISAPVWFDYIAKTVAPNARGKLMGFRTSIGAAVGLLNSLLLTLLLSVVEYPFSFSIALLIAFVFQMISWGILRKTVETVPSVVDPPVRFPQILSHARSLLQNDNVFRRFLVASAVSIVGSMPVAFLTVAFIARFQLGDSAIGIYTMIMVGSQIISAGALGWLADARGHKLVLLLCAGSMVVATGVAMIASSPGWSYVVFALVGLIMGAETMARYNFAVDCAPERNRAQYIGLMSATLSPFYAAGFFGGVLSELFSYYIMFGISIFFSLAGLYLLTKVPQPEHSTRFHQLR